MVPRQLFNGGVTDMMVEQQVPKMAATGATKNPDKIGWVNLIWTHPMKQDDKTRVIWRQAIPI